MLIFAIGAQMLIYWLALLLVRSDWLNWKCLIGYLFNRRFLQLIIDFRTGIRRFANMRGFGINRAILEKRRIASLRAVQLTRRL